MRAVYLVRHGAVDAPAGAYCLGREDLPLSPEGREQARALAPYFAPLTTALVLSSPLLRCRQTAELLAPDVRPCPGLLEVDMGEWTGLFFDEIRARWPEIYARRGRDPVHTAPPGGESLARCGVRGAEALRALLAGSPGHDLIAVAHGGVNAMALRRLTGREDISPQPRGSVAQLLVDGDRAWPGMTGFPGELPPPVPDEAACLKLLERAETPLRVREHCRAAAEVADGLCAALCRRGIILNAGLVRAGALLHDLRRAEPRHAEAGARWLAGRGYLSVAAVVGSHMELSPEEEGRWSESALVFLADKLVRETRRVTLEERFDASAAPPEKLPHLRRRYAQARALLDRLERGD